MLSIITRKHFIGPTLLFDWVVLELHLFLTEGKFLVKRTLGEHQAGGWLSLNLIINAYPPSCPGCSNTGRTTSVSPTRRSGWSKLPNHFGPHVILSPNITKAWKKHTSNKKYGGRCRISPGRLLFVFPQKWIIINIYLVRNIIRYCLRVFSKTNDLA